jgi:Ca-activated chloride channel family protein
MGIFRYLIVFCLALTGCDVNTSQAEEKAVKQIAQTPTVNGVPGPVTLSTTPHFNAVHFGSNSHLNVLVKLQASEAKEKKRPPLDLAVVIDTSGSMRGDKLRDSKRAALELLTTLRPEDRVTLIAYASNVNRLSHRLLVDNEGKETLRTLIMGLRSTGSTALGPALFDAFSALQTIESTMNLRHVILMSDGLANVGEKRPSVIGARAAAAFRAGISVSTMGVGLNYNEDLMTQVADQGGGRYHFIKDSAQIAGILGEELNGLVGTVARNVVLRFTGSDGVILSKAFGYPVERLGAESKVRIGFMGSKQVREIMLRVALDHGTFNSIKSGSVSLGRVAIEYVDVAADSETKKIQTGIKVNVASNAAASKKTENQDVAIRMGELEAANQMKIAARDAESGNFKGARGSIQQAIDSLSVQYKQNRSPRLKKQLGELQEAMVDVGSAAASPSARRSYTKKYKAKAYKQSKR